MRRLFLFLLLMLVGLSHADPQKYHILEARGPQTGMGPFIFHFNDHQSLQIYGRVNQAVMLASDGRLRPILFFTTNDNSISRLGFIARHDATEDFSILAQVEMGLRLNRSNRVSQIEQVRNDGIDFRKIELVFISLSRGFFYLGKGSTVSDKTAKQDISGTKIIANSNVAKIGGGLFFRTPMGTLVADMMNPLVGVAFNNIDGFKRRNRVRYDTPFYKGFSVGFSVAEERRYDTALRYRYKGKRARVVAAVAYTKSFAKLSVESNEDIIACSVDVIECIRDSGVDGSASVLFYNGISLTGAGGFLDSSIEGRKMAYYGYFKFGYLTHFVPYGRTAFSIDYGQYRHFTGNADRGNSWGLAAVQSVDDWHVRFYATVRRFSLNRPEYCFKPIYVAATGAIITF